MAGRLQDDVTSLDTEQEKHLLSDVTTPLTHFRDLLDWTGLDWTSDLLDWTSDPLVWTSDLLDWTGPVTN